jgi:hypothetical protein
VKEGAGKLHRGEREEENNEYIPEVRKGNAKGVGSGRSEKDWQCVEKRFVM